MQYLLLIYGDERLAAGQTPAESEALMERWWAYNRDITELGAAVAGNALQPTRTATTVRKSAEETLVSDGPFAETKEQLGGYYLIEAENLDKAIEIASRAPNLDVGGSIEIRPVRVFQ